jgi:hypothetical protein
VATIVFDRPRCLTNKVGFSLVHEKKRYSREHSFYTNVYSCMAECGHCGDFLIVDFGTRVGARAIVQSPATCHLNPEDYGYTMMRAYPESLTAKVPLYVPEPVSIYFSQAIRALKTESYDASGSMCRKTLDVSTQSLLKAIGQSAGTINARINKLYEGHLITAELQDWAHQIRIDGNAATHNEDPFSAEDAITLVGFVDL